MALPTTYNIGMATVNANAATVTGQGTTWLTSGLQAGDFFWAVGLSVRIASVNSNTSLTLAFGWPGATRTADTYEVRFTPEATRVLASTRAVLDALTNGVLYALAGLATAADRLPYFTGAGTAALTNFTTLARSLLAGTTPAAMRTTLQLAPVAASGLMSDITGAVVDAQVPARLKSFDAGVVADADTLVASGRYTLLSGSDNVPPNGGTWYIEVQAQSLASAAYQKAISAAAVPAGTLPAEWHRYRWYAGWSSWLPIRRGDAEMDSRYAQIAGPTTNKGQALGAAARLYSSVFTAALVVGSDTEGAPSIIMNGNAGAYKQFIWQSAGANKLLMRLNNSDDFEIGRRDGSTILGTPLLISRTSGSITLEAPLKLASYTVATLPSASAFSGCSLRVTNGSGGKNLATSDGTNWRFADGAIVS